MKNLLPQPLVLECESRILDHLAVGVFTVNRDFRITFFNEQAQRMTGFTLADALGRRCYEIFRADTCFQACPLKEAIDSGQQVTRRRVCVLTKHNSELPVEITAAALLDEHGQVVGGVESFVDDSERAFLAKKVKGEYMLQDLVGQGPAMQRIFEVLPVLAASNVSVLIQGETGTGKSLLARALHNLSKRHDKPFVSVNCAALPESLLESELFGYKKGAFTDAKQDKPGRFLLAHQGSLLLDEIGDLPLPLQAKLLQVLEDKEFFPLGGAKPEHADVRVMAATNCDLERMVAEHRFRADLYYRLRVAVLELPPLRQRREDLPLLLDQFLTELASLGEHAELRLGPRARKALMSHDYPGNVRELRNILEYAAAVQQRGVIRLEDLPPALIRPQPARSEEPPASTKAGTPESDQESEELRAALEQARWNRAEAAKLLGVSRTTLWRKMQRLGL